MLRLAVWALALLGGVRAGSYSYEYKGSFLVELSLGTPNQGPFKFFFEPVLTKFLYHKATVTDKASGGFFNPKASKTFKLGRVIDEDGYTGTDTIKLLNGPTLSNAALVIDKRDTTYGRVALGHGEEGDTSFMDEVLKALGGKKTVILAVKESKFLSHYGTLVLGDDKPKVCKDSWTVYPAHEESYMQMTIDSTDVEIGKYHQSGVITLAFESEFIWLDKKTHAAAVKQLGVKENEEIDCDTKTQIKIKTAHHEFVIEPKDYVQDWGGICRFNIIKSPADAIMIPLRFLNKQCIRFDFDLNTVSLAPMA